MTDCSLLNLTKFVTRYGTRKLLKLRTLARKKMSRAMSEFAKHIGVEVNNLRFHLHTGVEVEKDSKAGQYRGKVVMVTDA